MGSLHRLGVNLSSRDLEVLPLVRKLPLAPGTGNDLQRFVHHAGGVLEVNSEGCHLVRVAGAADAQVHPSLAQDIKGGRPRSDVQRVLHRRNCHRYSQPDAGCSLADGSQGNIRRAGVRPFSAELVVSQPDAFEPLLFSKDHLVHHLPMAVIVAAGRPGLGNLYLVKHPDLH